MSINCPAHSNGPSQSSLANTNTKRGIVCVYCGKAWGYEGEKPTDALIKEAVDHEAKCPHNPHLAEIQRLQGIIVRNALQRLRPDDGPMYVTADDIKASLEILYAWQADGKI